MVRDKTKSKFSPPARHPTPTEERELMKRVIYTAIMCAMNNHYYKFDQVTYRQVKGGGIGDTFAQAGARLIMLWWDSTFKTLVISQTAVKLNLRVLQRYVDDLNVKTGTVSPGTTWDPSLEQLTIKPLEQLTEEDVNKPGDLRTAEVYRDMANHILPMFQWTLDTPSLNQDQKIPVLDLKI